MPEIVGDAALLCDPNKAETIAQAISELWGNAELQMELKIKGKQRGKIFSWNQNASETVAIYQSIVKSA
jgi:glycosyltransferase involved in cell wall biosynthesis